MTYAYILDAVRTPRGRGKMGKGALSGIHPQELLAQTLNQLAMRTGIDRRDIDDVIVGCVTQANEQGANIARNAVLATDRGDRLGGASCGMCLWGVIGEASVAVTTNCLSSRVIRTSVISLAVFVRRISRGTPKPMLEIGGRRSLRPPRGK